ncbi:MAG: tetratricopeptide repeat protein [Candidatus Aminicenantes bacterium]|nr:tetratricopeptide repeat protein [Candidatus Aminicenantes bacterium]
MKAKMIHLLCLLLGISLVLFSQSAEDLIAQGDALYLEMQDMDTANKALELYREALNSPDKKYDTYWRMARIHYFIGMHTESKKEQKTIFSQGVYYATKAVALEPERPDGHYWLGVNNGKVGETRGVLKSLSLVKPIKKSMNKVLELDPTYEDGGADRVLGRVYYKLPGFAGGSKDKSREHLEKSKELGPDDPVTRVYLAETYLALKEVEKARAELDYVLNMDPDPRWYISLEHAKQDARKLLEEKEFQKE